MSAGSGPSSAGEQGVVRALTALDFFRDWMWQLEVALDTIEKTAVLMRAFPPRAAKEINAIETEVAEAYCHARALYAAVAVVPPDATVQDQRSWRRLRDELIPVMKGYFDARAAAAAAVGVSGTSSLQKDVQSVINEIASHEQGGKGNAMQQGVPEGEAYESTGQVDSDIASIHRRSVELTYIADAVAALGLQGVDVQVKVAGLHELGERCENLARTLGLQAIAEGKLSQAQLSRLLGVAPMTVNRWVKAGGTEGAEA